MASLPQDVIDDICRSDDLNRVISCGIDPDDRSLCIVTARLDVRHINPNGLLIPQDAMPSHDGSRIAITFDAHDGIYAIDSSLAILRSVSALQGADLSVAGSSLGEFVVSGETYLIDDEKDNETPEGLDQGRS